MTSCAKNDRNLELYSLYPSLFIKYINFLYLTLDQQLFTYIVSIMIIAAIILIFLGAAIKYGKLYFLIAGYNTMSESEKSKVDIDGIATLFRNVTWGMALVMLLGALGTIIFNNSEIEISACLLAIVVGIPYLIIRSNSKKYKR